MLLLITTVLFPRLDDLLRDIRRHDLVVIEFHHGAALAGSHGTKLGGVAEHFGKRNFCDDREYLTFGLTAFDLTALGSDRAVDVAHVFLGRNDFELHDRFEQYRLGALGGILESL